MNSHVSKVPKWLETYHLTLLTIPWSALIILFGYMAQKNIHWLWGVSVMIFFQYITDLFDGAVGRLRNTGLIKWGFFMDHFLDYVFLCSILICYTFLLQESFRFVMLFVLALFSSFMVASFLSFAATNEFKISYLKLGPTEVRIIFIIINTLLIFLGPKYLQKSLPYVLGCSLFALCVVVFRIQKHMWKIDMEVNKSKEG